MSEEHSADLADRFHVYDQQVVAVDDFESSGFVLDVGGGGEGIIGVLKGSQVVAIDLRESELAEAPKGPLKLVMDARDMRFLDGTFETATAFFALMYLKSRADCRKVFAEVHRVLKPGGRFLIWEASVSRPAATDKPAYVILLRVLVGGRHIETGYGQPWPDEPRDPEYCEALATEAGFEVVEATADGRLFRLVVQKPRAGDGSE